MPEEKEIKESQERKCEDKEAERQGEEVEQLKNLVEEKKKEVEQLKNQMLYLQADFENFRKRKEREIAETKKLLLVDFMKHMLPIIDDFELMEKNLKGRESDSVVAGLMALKKNFFDSLTRMGLDEIALTQFDPNYHEVEAVVPAQTDNIVVEVVRKGYTVNGIVIRPAKVIVGKRSQEEQSQNS